jgi:hypothetical protein
MSTPGADEMTRQPVIDWCPPSPRRLAGYLDYDEIPADVDWVVVARALDPHRKPPRGMTHAERVAVARHVILTGQSATQLARLLRVSGATARALLNEAAAELGLSNAAPGLVLAS